MWCVFHSNLAQPPRSLIKTICYPNLFKVNTKAVQHGCQHEDDAIKAYEIEMKTVHVNFELKQCGLFINKDYPFLHATPDFLTSCDCCGQGREEVKFPICISQDCDFDQYVMKKIHAWQKINGNFGNCEEELPKKPVGRLSVDCRLSVGRLSTVCWPTVARLSANCWPSVGRLLADCRLFVGRLLADRFSPKQRLSVGQQSADKRPTVGRQLVMCR